ncbi:Bug family tripartite tricarboxylate transporter substrate binding protein [Planotetraspora sp. GP83]|uniref:Bug family tripartite tricarboxylate transporter substrate binding protein n=1 Tax=Planotetraspora sp. GP83 TaxID=3156264 RepID=UPI0035191BD2
MRRRAVLVLGAGVAALAAGCGTDGPPSQGDISLVVPGSAGNLCDGFARELKALIEGRKWARSVNIRSRQGDGGSGTPSVARFVAAGRRGDLMVADPALIAVAAMDRARPFAVGASPLARLAGQWEVLVTSPDSRFRTFDDFAAALLRDPSGAKVAGGAPGGADHLLYGLTAQGLGVDLRLLHYTSFGDCSQAVAAMLDGRATIGFGGHGDVARHIAAGRLRPLAVSSPERLAGVDAPTLVESGVRLIYADWFGLLGPGTLGDRERDALLDLCRAVDGSPSWRRACARNGWTPMCLAGDDFRQWLTSEAGRTKRVLGDLGLL